MTAESKITPTAVHLHQRRNAPFFKKQGQGNLFTKPNEPTATFFSPTFIQPKLTIGQPDDEYEKEADAMANKVVQRIASPEVMMKKDSTLQMKPLASAITPLVQKKCAHCEEEEKKQKGIQRKCAECEKEEEQKLQTKSEISSLSGTHSRLERNLNSSKGGGNPLPLTLQTQMEHSFGADFSDVRLHTGNNAVQMNQDLHAQAFTHGSDIYFNTGKLETNSTRGKHLLAHELTHVVQQGKGVHKKVQRTTQLNQPPFSAPQRNEGDNSGPPPAPRVCGPNVSGPVSVVWSRIQAEFQSWPSADKLAAAVYLIAPYVPEAGTNPRSAGGSALFQGSWAEPFISIIAALSNDPFISAYVSMTNSQWQLNRDAFDTIGLFVLSADWLFGVPGCAVPGCSGLSASSLPRGQVDPCEDPANCSMTVQMGSGCWLSGTVNYGTYGIMMREAYNWCDAQRSRMISALIRIWPLSLGNPAAAMMLLRATMSDYEIAAALIKELFSYPSLLVYVGGYKLWDMENPADPLSWAIATYNGGASAIPAGDNRPSCQTTCGNLNPALFSGWDYVWEPVKHR